MPDPERTALCRLYDKNDHDSEDFHRFGHVHTAPTLSDWRRPQVLDLRFPLAQEKTNTYLIGAEGSRLVKIGLAKKPQSRLASLQTGQPMTLSLLWTCEGDYEQELHQKFAEQWVRGEWFDLTPLGDSVEVVANALTEIKANQR